MLLGGRPGEIPKLLEPPVELVFGNHAKFALVFGRLPVAAGLALHQDEFDVVFDDGVRFVWFAEELRAV